MPDGTERVVADNRIAVPLNPVAEVENVVNRGAKPLLLPTGPVNGRSPGDPIFDPLWSRLNAAGATVAFHIMENSYNEAIAPAWGMDPTPVHGTWQPGSG